MASSSLPRKRDRSRKYDIVLFGVTGFTGRLVAEYLLPIAAAQDVRLAFAGRNEGKLSRVRDELAKTFPNAADVPLVIANSRDADSLDAMAQDAEVVCTTVGPYARRGVELVAACVRSGTDYCDLTGEVHFMRATIDAHHEAAQASGARIVHTCGFDSIPSDLGTLMMQAEAKRRFGQPLDELKMVVSMKGGFSGGTIASMAELMEDAMEDRDLRRKLANPYALNPDPKFDGPDGRDLAAPHYDADLDLWTAPFVMASVNTRVVRRSNALAEFSYGEDFRYAEVMRAGRGVKGRLTAYSVAGVLGGFAAAMAWSPARTALRATVLPSPGEGPDKEARDNGFFVARFYGTGRDGSGKPVTLKGRVEGKADPGYGETAKMLGESALCLALDGEKLDSPGGVRTPATTMGKQLIDRLVEAGMVFELD